MNTVKAMSQRAAREALGTPESFSGGVYVTKNGTPELFITTAADRAQEQAADRPVGAGHCPRPHPQRG